MLVFFNGEIRELWKDETLRVEILKAAFSEHYIVITHDLSTQITLFERGGEWKRLDTINISKQMNTLSEEEAWENIQRINGVATLSDGDFLIGTTGSPGGLFTVRWTDKP